MSRALELLREVATYANKTLPPSVSTKIEMVLHEASPEDEEARRPYYEKELAHFREAYVRSQSRVYALECQVSQLLCRINELSKPKA
jgi:hypothetical protein